MCVFIFIIFFQTVCMIFSLLVFCKDLYGISIVVMDAFLAVAIGQHSHLRRPQTKTGPFSEPCVDANVVLCEAAWSSLENFLLRMTANF